MYLIDTNICIYFIKGKFDLDKKFKKVKNENCYISEISLAELMFGVENSQNKETNKIVLDNFLSGIKILPIFHSIEFYAREKARLRKTGKTIDDFDLLIGATAVIHNMIMVTNNTSHFENIKGIKLEDWTK